jgi:hypothetical protein
MLYQGGWLCAREPSHQLWLAGGCGCLAKVWTSSDSGGWQVTWHGTVATDCGGWMWLAAVSRCYSSRLLSRCWICRRSLHGDTFWQPGTSFLRRSSTDGFVHVDLDSNVTSVRSPDHVRGPESKIDPRVKSQQVSASLSKWQWSQAETTQTRNL